MSRTAVLTAEIDAIREAIGHTEKGPLYDLDCREDLVRLRAALVEHETNGCPSPGRCGHAWAAGQINTHCRAALAEGDES